jgi:anti-sigma factor RsiW
MNCKEIKHLILTDYVDGELSPAKAKLLESHLAGCSACRLQAQAMQQQGEIFAQGPNIGTPHEMVWNRIKTGIRERGTVSGVAAWGFPAWRPVFAATVLLILLTAGIVFRNSVSHQPYLTYVMGTDPAAADDITAGIEEYFL